MRDKYAIELENVTKIYTLFGSQRDQLIHALGLQRFGFTPRTEGKDYVALDNITINVNRGHRVGIVGRNGAGKTTLLKLICGNYTPTSGSIMVNGSVQALMSTGLGFHPGATGRENVESSLQYTGLKRDEYSKALEDIIVFCELGDYFDQPFKTYSLGMQARLMFAVATAIKPEILIVDEVLSAGDAYFVAKSKQRVEKLISSGCTMLLVSHSMQQILELCDEAIWLDEGQIRMQDESFLVVKAYEEYLHGPVMSKLTKQKQHDNSLKESKYAAKNQNIEFTAASERELSLPQDVLLQIPFFLPHQERPTLPKLSAECRFDNVAPGGVSRWDSENGLKVSGFTIVTEAGYTNKLITLRPAKFAFTILAERAGKYMCRYGIAIDNQAGAQVTRIYSPSDEFEIDEHGLRRVEILLNPVQLGPGEYTLGISVLDSTALEYLNKAHRYDLVSRSFEFKVELPDSMGILNAEIVHTAEWGFYSK